MAALTHAMDAAPFDDVAPLQTYRAGSAGDDALNWLYSLAAEVRTPDSIGVAVIVCRCVTSRVLYC